MKVVCGIYKITNIVNEKCYIGQSHNIYDRWIRHRSRAFQVNDSNYNSYFYRSIRKYGLDKFRFEILEECVDSNLSEREKYYIGLFDSNNPLHGYNMTLGGEGRLLQNRNRVIDLWNQGFFIGEIAKLISGSRNTVKQILTEYQIDFGLENHIRWIKRRSREIDQYDRNMNFLKTWPSTNEIERKLHINKKSISNCCNYLAKTAGGYKWRYANRSETAAMADLLD